MKLKQFRYHFFILELLLRWLSFMVIPFLPMFGWFFLYNMLLYILDKPVFNRNSVDVSVFVISLIVHIMLITTAILMLG